MGTARAPVVGSGDLAGVHGLGGKLMLLRFRHDDLLQLVDALRFGKVENAAAAPTTKTARILIGDPGRSTSESVALSAYAAQGPRRTGPQGIHIHMAMTAIP